MTDTSTPPAADRGRKMILPLALAQFIASYAATNMNVAISAIAKDLGTTVAGVQTAITLFTLTMAALMIPGSKVTDIWGRRRCFVAGLLVYGIGGLLALLSQGLPLLIAGYSLLEGVGSALMIPPIYILITVAFPDMKSRARYFGVVSGAGGLGAAAGPLIGGLVTSAISWRASFGVQVLVVAWIILLARKIDEPALSASRPRFDVTGATLSAAGLFFVVLGLLQSRTYGFLVSRTDFKVGGTVVIPEGSVSPVWLFVAIGAIFLAGFCLHLRSAERKHRQALLSLRLFRNKTSNLGLGTQIIQWLVLQGTFFVVSVYLQQVDHYDAIRTGLMLTPATFGILAAAAGADRFARRHPQRWLIIAGFLVTVAGMALLLALVRAHSGIATWIPGLLLFGIGVGVMLTSSVNVVQSSFPDQDQAEISGLSRSVSNLGSSLGTALVGSVLVAVTLPAGKPFAVGLAVMLTAALIGLVISVLIPRAPAGTPEKGTRSPHEGTPGPARGHVPTSTSLGGIGMTVQARQNATARRTRPVGGPRYGLLLLVLIATYLLSAFTAGQWVNNVQILAFAGTLLLALRNALVPRRAAAVAVAVVLAGSAVMAGLALSQPSDAVLGAAQIWTGLILLVTVIVIVHRILSSTTVTLQSIYAALSAYMIIALMFAAFYAAMNRLGGGPFFADGSPGNTRTFQYFSFTTLTTLGYGDFTAASNAGRAVAVMEAMAGQIFLVTLVARLVSAFRPSRPEPPAGGELPEQTPLCGGGNGPGTGRGSRHARR